MNSFWHEVSHYYKVMKKFNLYIRQLVIFALFTIDAGPKPVGDGKFRHPHRSIGKIHRQLTI
jgi:hypothetical protein